MDRRGKVVVLASGGVDSAALLGWAAGRYAKVQPVYCRFGLRWERAEMHWLKKLLSASRDGGLLPLAVLELSASSLYGGHWSLTGRHVPGYRSKDPSVYLPGRNALLLSLASVYAVAQGFDEILIGTLAGNPFPDATPRFFRAMEKALTLALGTKIKIRSPFQRLTKTAVIPFGRSLPLHDTFSCLNPKGVRPCGACNKCAEKDRVSDLFPPFGI